MLDKFCYKFFSGIDNICEWIANKLSGPRCKCKKIKKGEKPQKPENGKPIPLPIWGYYFIE